MTWRLWIDTTTGTYGTIEDADDLVIVEVDQAEAERIDSMTDNERCEYGRGAALSNNEVSVADVAAWFDAKGNQQ